uniref:Uncharacterized protein n=1 Tax=Arundo donax TaxID=35708 RepID=A0A0A9A1X0_ARUDO
MIFLGVTPLGLKLIALRAMNYFLQSALRRS